MKIFKKFMRKRGVRLGTSRSGHVFDAPFRIRADERKKDFYLVATSIMRDEGLYLEEWIEFHRLVGVEHFVLYDNESTDETATILQRYIETGLVTLIPWPHFCVSHNLQMLAFSHALSLMGGRTTWLCCVDLDEFLFPTETDDLKEALVEFESEPAVGVNYAWFGTSGHEKKPAGLLTENYTSRMAYNGRDPAPGQERTIRKMTYASNFKSIVQPTRVVSTIGAHSFKTDRFPVLAVDGAGNEIRRNQQRPISFAKFQLNHYYSKSREEWESRIARGEIKGSDKVSGKQLFLDAIEGNLVEDREIQRFLPRLRESISHRRIRQ